MAGSGARASRTLCVYVEGRVYCQAGGAQGNLGWEGGRVLRGWQGFRAAQAADHPLAHRVCVVVLYGTALPNCTACRFYSELIKFRRQHPLLGRAEFLTEQVPTALPLSA
jgi:hypothetical protein